MSKLTPKANRHLKTSLQSYSTTFQALGGERVRQHIPARIGGFFPDEMEYGIDKRDDSAQQAVLIRSRRKRIPYHLIKSLGLVPRAKVNSHPAGPPSLQA